MSSPQKKRGSAGLKGSPEHTRTKQTSDTHTLGFRVTKLMLKLFEQVQTAAADLPDDEGKSQLEALHKRPGFRSAYDAVAEFHANFSQEKFTQLVLEI